jgi:ribosomal peptide maturation radical SAM protein 1
MNARVGRIAASRTAPGLDVLLVSMPFAPSCDPSLGSSLLKATLPNRRVSIRYFTLPFADRIGAQLYDDLSRGLPSPSWLVGEALFRNALFPARRRSLARYLRAAGRHAEPASARLLEAALRVEHRVEPFLQACVRTVLETSPRIVGFTSLFQQQVASLALARRLKRERPDLFLVIGGGNCNGPAGIELARQFPFLDAVVSGEGEIVFREIVERVMSGRDLEGLQGVHTARNSRGPIARAVVAARGVKRLDDLPVPDYSDFFRQWASSRIARRLEPRLPFETSRGCWWGEKHHCTFCGVNGPALTFRQKSTARALTEFRVLLSRFPARRVPVCDSVPGMDSFGGFLPALARRRRRVELMWAVRPNLRKEHLRMLFAAGIREIQPGIESLSDGVLSLMNKGVTALQNIQLLKWCVEIGIQPTWNLIWGFPGEPRDEYARMTALLPLLAHLPPPTEWGRLRLVRFSPNFEQAGARGITNVAPWPSYSFLYPFRPDCVANLAHFFTFSYADGRRVSEYAAPLAAAIQRWRRAHARSDLVWVEHGKRLLIVDLRSGAAGQVTILDGRMKALYLACDAVRTLASLAREATLREGIGRHAGDIAQALAPLIDRGLMLRDGDRVLSLAIRRKPG